jgi:hypothetical protein
MTSSPPFVSSVGFLIANPSGGLLHSLSIAIVSSVVPVSRFLFSATSLFAFATSPVGVDLSLSLSLYFSL